MDVDTKDKFCVSLNLASAKQLQVILKTYNLSTPDNFNKDKLWEILQCSNRFLKDFTNFTPENISATFSSDDRLTQLASADGKVSLIFKQSDTPSPCTACDLEVCNGTSTLGQGLQCANCECWFHNQCNPVPLSIELFELLAESPNFLKVYCPPCMHDNYVSNSKLHAEFLSLKAEVLEIKKTLNPDNIAEQVLDQPTIEAHCEDIQRTMSSVSTSAKEMKTGLDNTLTSVENVTEQMVQSMQRFDNFTITNLSNLINDSIRGLSDKLSPDVLLNENVVDKLSHNLATHLAKSCQTGTVPNNSHILTPDKQNVGVEPLPMYSEILRFGTTAPTSPALQTATNEGPKNAQHTLTSDPMDTQQTPISNQPAKAKALCDENKTVAIDKITNFTKFVKNTRDTKKEFNTHFCGMKIVHAKGTRRGTLLIELSTPEDAADVVRKWKPSYFSEDNGADNKTVATLLKDKNCKGVLHHIDHDYSEDFIQKEISEKANLKKNVTVKRFMKGSSKLSTVLLTFECREDLETCLNKGLTIGRSFEDVHPYKRTPTVLRCWKCWKFDHTAAWCTRKTKTCQYCAQDHDAADCLIHKDGDESQYKCVNCKEDRSHASSSNDCPAFLEKRAQAFQYTQL